MEMSNLPADILAELRDAIQAESLGNDGKARVCARRAVGKAFALTKYFGRSGRPVSATESLKIILDLDETSLAARDAARRLSTSVTEAKNSQISTKTVDDALIIIRELLADRRSALPGGG